MPNESHLHAGQPAEETTSGFGPGYEVRDVNIRGIVRFIVGMAVALTLTQFAMWWLLNAIAGKRAPEATPTSPYAESTRQAGYVPPAGKITPEVALEITEQRRKLNAEERALLGGEADHDPKGGPARVIETRGGPSRIIPIDRAIDLIAERGLPVASGPGRTEVEVNSHAGKPAPNAGDKPGKTGDGPGVDAPEVPGKGAKK